MSKQPKSLTVAGKGKPIPKTSLTQPFISPAILEMRRMEAREWIRRYKAKAKEIGPMQARGWWEGVISDIEKIRGKDSATQLRYWMNQEK